MRQELQWKTVDNWKRHSFLKVELKRKLLLSIRNNKQIPFVYRQYAYYKITHLPIIINTTKHINRCVITGRRWGVLKKFQLSRFAIRDAGYFALLPGFRRISW